MRTYTYISLATTIVVFILSLVISPYYFSGDQYSYNKVFSALSELSLQDGYRTYYRGLSSREPVAFFLSWLASKFLTKHEFVALANSALAFATMKLLSKWRTSALVAVIIVSSNFYLYVLYFAAERLKLGFIFLLFALAYIQRKRFYIFALASVMGHAQLFIVYISMLFKFSVEEMRKVWAGSKPNKALVAAFLILGLMVWVMSDQLIEKFQAYYSMKGALNIMDTAKLFVFCALTMFYTRERIQAFMLFVPLFLVALLLGGDRVNLFGYFIFLFFALRVNRGFNIGVAVTSIYFAYKTYILLSKIFIYANGFTSLPV